MDEMHSTMNLSAKLSSDLNSQHLRLLDLVKNAAGVQGCVVYLVGGSVRDLLLDMPISDFDLVVEGEAIQLGEELIRKNGGRLVAHRRFGTATWHLPAELARLADLNALDLATARTESYREPSALPEVVQSNIRLDSARRDFAINTLAVPLNGKRAGELCDYWGGLDDLKHGRVRVLHTRSFVDDATRVFRAVRLEQRLKFSLDNQTARLISSALPLIELLSGDRVRHEIESVFAELEPEVILRRLDKLGVLEAVHQGLGDSIDEWLRDCFVDARRLVQSEDLLDVYFGLWLIRLDREVTSAICRRIGLRPRFVSMLEEWVEFETDLVDVPTEQQASALVKMLDGRNTIALQIMRISTSDIGLRSKLGLYIDHLKSVKPSVDGEYLERLGVKPGPIYGLVISKLRDAWLDGDVVNVDEERELLKGILAGLM